MNIAKQQLVHKYNEKNEEGGRLGKQSCHLLQNLILLKHKVQVSSSWDNLTLSDAEWKMLLNTFEQEDNVIRFLIAFYTTLNDVAKGTSLCDSIQKLIVKQYLWNIPEAVNWGFDDLLVHLFKKKYHPDFFWSNVKDFCTWPEKKIQFATHYYGLMHTDDGLHKCVKTFQKILRIYKIPENNTFDRALEIFTTKYKKNDDNGSNEFWDGLIEVFNAFYQL